MVVDGPPGGPGAQLVICEKGAEETSEAGGLRGSGSPENF